MPIDPQRPVRVFRNWKRGCYNLMQDGRLVASARQVRIADAEFRVRESGRQRMLRTGRRNVHAWAVGRLVDAVHPDEPRTLSRPAGRTVVYRPLETGAFVDVVTGTPVRRAALVQLDEQGVVCSNA